MGRPWRRNKAILVTFGCLQNILVGGILFGWASVAGTLLIAPTEQGGAALTVEETATIFATAASVCSLSSLVLGIVLDKLGPRVCSFMSHIIIGAGLVLFSRAETYAHVNLAACLIGFGGPGIQSSVVHIANLFEQSQFLVISLVTGSMTLSFAVLPIFEALWERYGIGFRHMFGSYVFVVLLSSVVSLVLWPDSPFEKEVTRSEQVPLLEQTEEEPSPEQVYAAALEHTHLVEQPLRSFLRRNPHHKLDRKQSYIVSQQAIENDIPSLLSLKDQPFSLQVTSFAYWRILVVFICTSFLANFYVASLTIELADTHLFSEKEQHHLARTFTLIMAFGTPMAFVVGWLMDLVGLEACTMLMLILGQLHVLTVVFLGEWTPMMLVAFLFYMCFRHSLFPIYLACLSSRLGFKYFGILSGIGFALSGIAQFSMSSLLHTTQGTCHVVASDNCDTGSWIQLHVLQLCMLFALGLVPMLDYRSRVLQQKHVEDALGTIVPKSLTDSTYGSMDSMGDDDRPRGGGIEFLETTRLL